MQCTTRSVLAWFCPTGTILSIRRARGTEALLKSILSLLLCIHSASSYGYDRITADLRADVNRDGEVFLGQNDPSRDDKTAQTDWSMRRGAIVLPNLDDDTDRCETSSDKLSVCHDARDTVINGAEDLLDLAPLYLMPLPQVSEKARAQISIKPIHRSKARLFIEKDQAWQYLPPNQLINAEHLRNGINLRIEARDVVRDVRRWRGDIDVEVKIVDQGITSTDRVRFHVAPLVFQHDLMSLKRLYLPGMPWGQDEQPASFDSNRMFKPMPRVEVSGRRSGFSYLSILDAANPSLVLAKQNGLVAEKLGLLGSAYQAFYDEFVLAASIAQPDVQIVDLSTYEDPWVQDMFEMAYTSMPKAGGKTHLMHIAVRSAQPLRMSANIPLTEVLGPDVGIVEQWFDAKGRYKKNGDDSLNSSGNFGTIPPYQFKNQHYPLGRIIYGAGKAWFSTGGGIIDSSLPATKMKLKKRFPDVSFVKMLTGQGMQKPVVIDTAWLAVGHVDEVVAFIPASNDKSWKLVVADPMSAWNLLKAMVERGQGDTKFLSGLEAWSDGLEAEVLQRSVADIVNNSDLADAQRVAQDKIQTVIDTLKAETGIQEEDIIRLPVLFEPTYFNPRLFSALTPNPVNLVVLGRHAIAVAKQHGPKPDGVDLLQEAVVKAFSKEELQVFWVEDYIQAHGGIGEIHCQSNALRDPALHSVWWESSQMNIFSPH